MPHRSLSQNYLVKWCLDSVHEKIGNVDVKSSVDQFSVILSIFRGALDQLELKVQQVQKDLLVLLVYRG